MTGEPEEDEVSTVMMEMSRSATVTPASMISDASGALPAGASVSLTVSTMASTLSPSAAGRRA